MLITTLVLGAAGMLAAEPFPIRHDASTVAAIAREPSSWEGKILGFTGKIDRIETGSGGILFLELVLSNPNPAGTKLWVESLVLPAAGGVRDGDVVRALGYLYLVTTTDAATKATHSEPFELVAVCLVNVTTKTGFFLPDATQQCQAWQAGTLP